MHNRDRIGTCGVHHATTAHHGFSPRRARRIAGLVLGALLFLGAPRAEAAFGVSPPWVKHSAVLVGTTLSQTVTYSTDAPDEGSLFTFTESSCDAELASWMTVTLATGLELHPGDTGPWPAGQQQLPTVVHVPIPLDATLGERRCMLMGKLCAPGVDGGGVSICLGASVLVDVVVTDQPLVAYATKGVRLSPYYVKLGDPVHIELDVENTGNVNVTSVRVDASVWPHNLGAPYPGPYTAQGTNSVLATPIPAYQISPRATREMTFPFTRLPLGIYYLGVTTFNGNGVDYQNNYYLEVYSCPPCEGLTQGTGTQCHVPPELEGTSCPGGTCVRGVCGTPDGGVPEPGRDASAIDKNGQDIVAIDVGSDTASAEDGGPAGMDVGPMDTVPSDTPLGAPGSTDARADAASLPDGGSPASDLANADRANGSLPDTAVADAPIGAGQVDATPVHTVDAAAVPVDEGSANRMEVGAAAVDTSSSAFPDSAATDAGVDAGLGSAASGKGCSCQLGRGTQESATTWLLVVGLLALSRLAPRRKKPRP
jgi:hypothetical protein